jgi:hypothetical protein
MKAESRGINITLNGTMGNNGWYVSDVTISFTVDNINVSSIKYRLDNGSWQTYTAPEIIRVHEDGYHSFELMVIDTDGNVWYGGPVYFKIDQTPPFILITKERTGLFRWKITVVPSDNMSGFSGTIEFYINGVLQFTANVPGPYEWTFVAWMFWKSWSLTVRVYDIAGNFADAPTTNSLNKIQSNMQSYYQHNRLFTSRINSVFWILEGLQ